jgi:hypothetical protein
MSRILQLCGRAPGFNQAPPDIGAERWIIGSAFHEHVGTAYTRVFDVHPVEPFEAFKGIRALRTDAWAWYGQQDRPVYLLEPHPEVPTSVAYPWAAIADRFGLRGGCAISSTIDQMMALALLEGFEEIHLCGVRLLNVEEWLTQRECLAYWIGRAESMGVVVETDPVAALCAPERIYGTFQPTGARRAPGLPVLVFGRPGDDMVPGQEDSLAAIEAAAAMRG